MKKGGTSVLLKVYVKMQMKAVAYQYVIMIMSVIHMSHVIVLTVIRQLITVPQIVMDSSLCV